MKIKVCGLGIDDQIQELDNLEEVDFLGFIFYQKSARYIDSRICSTKNSKRVGVFVNEEHAEIIRKIVVYQLDVIQLHGDESIEYIKSLINEINFISENKIEIFKAFGINEKTDFEIFKTYEETIDCFVFDTKSENYGGTGISFNWNLLEKYTGNVPFLLSGGISLESVQKLKNMNHRKCIGFDLNSGFESSPKNKDLKKVKEFIVKMKLK